MVTTAFSVPLCRSIWRKCASTTSSDETSRAAIARASSVTLVKTKSGIMSAALRMGRTGVARARPEAMDAFVHDKNFARSRSQQDAQEYSVVIRIHRAFRGLAFLLSDR